MALEMLLEHERNSNLVQGYYQFNGQQQVFAFINGCGGIMKSISIEVDQA